MKCMPCLIELHAMAHMLDCKPLAETSALYAFALNDPTLLKVDKFYSLISCNSTCKLTF